MATNENVNKVIYGNQTVMDITDTTAEESDVASGEVFYKASGERSVGTLNADSAVWGNIRGTLSDQTDLQIELNRAYTKTASETSSIDDLDLIPVQKISASSDGRRNVKFRNFKSILKGFFDDIYQAILTFDNTPTVNSDNPVKSSGIYNALMPKVSESLLKSTVGWTGKNLLPNNATSQTINGVRFRVNADKSVTLNGTATADTDLFLYGSWLARNNNIYKVGVPYHVSMKSSKNAGYHAYVQTFVNGAAGTTYVNSSTEGTFTIASASEDGIRIMLVVENGATFNNDIVYPMLRDASITDDTYEPYHESVEKEIEQIYADNGVLGAKNILPNNAKSQTINGVTFTVNEDGSVTANGTATGADASINLISISDNYVIPKGNYILSKGFSLAGVGLLIEGYNGTSWVKTIGASGSSDAVNLPIDFNGYDRLRCRMYVTKDSSINNLTFYPMLRLASDPDDTYVPYAMTNRELTEAIETIPTVHNGQLTIQQNGTNKATFTANQSGNATANIVTDDWVATGTVSGGAVSFSGIDDSGNYGYKPFAEVTASSTNKNPTAQISTLSGTGTSSMSVTYTTDADDGTTVKLRRIK